MVDMTKTIVAKSDQLNADDLIGGPIVATVTRVTEGSAEQPINIFYEGGGTKPFRPCKSMRRVLVHVWGADGTQFIGKSMTLYRDPAVRFGGDAIGGIRISHVSHIDKPQQMALQATKGKRALYTVQPLKIAVQTQQERAEENQRQTMGQWVNRQIEIIQGCPSIMKLQELTSRPGYLDALSRVEAADLELHGRLLAAAAKRAEELSEEVPFDAETGEIAA